MVAAEPALDVLMNHIVQRANEGIELAARQPRPPEWLRDYEYAPVLSSVVEQDESEDITSIISPDGQRTFTLAEVKQREDWPHFQEAMRVELEAIEK